MKKFFTMLFLMCISCQVIAQEVQQIVPLQTPSPVVTTEEKVVGESGDRAIVETFTTDQHRMYELHSAYRVRSRMPLQILDLGLCRQAQRLAVKLNEKNVLAHSDWSWQENTAIGAGTDYTYEMWINSGAHRANLLCGRTHVGFGMCNGHSAALFGNSYIGPDLEVRLTSVHGSGRLRRGLFGRRR